MEVTVVIPFYNPGKYLVQAVASVFQQGYRDWYLILVDDGSTDKSHRLIGEYLKDKRVTMIKVSKNLGQAKSLNLGLALVTTPFLLQLDADDWLTPDALTILVNEAKKHPKDVAVFHGNYTFVHQDKHGKTTKTTLRKGRFYKDRYDFLLSGNTVIPRFYRTECLKEVGGWSLGGPLEDRYSEDKRMLLKLATKYRFHWIDKMLYYYRLHGQNLTSNRDAIIATKEWYIRNTLKQWGDEYEPVFTTDKTGSKKLAELKPKAASRKGKT